LNRFRFRRLHCLRFDANRFACGYIRGWWTCLLTPTRQTKGNGVASIAGGKVRIGLYPSGAKSFLYIGNNSGSPSGSIEPTKEGLKRSAIDSLIAAQPLCDLTYLWGDIRHVGSSLTLHAPTPSSHQSRNRRLADVVAAGDATLCLTAGKSFPHFSCLVGGQFGLPAKGRARQTILRRFQRNGRQNLGIRSRAQHRFNLTQSDVRRTRT